MNTKYQPVLSIVYIAGAILLLVGAVYQINRGFNMDQSERIYASDRLLYSELQDLPISPLLALEHNKIYFSVVKNLDAADVEIEWGETEEGAEENTVGMLQPIAGQNWHMDRIGLYQDAIVTVTGDIYQQIYILKHVSSEYNRFLAINKIEADENKMIIMVRLYGSKIESVAGVELN